MINLKSAVESAVTLSQGIKVIKDISNDTKEIYNKSKDLPVFSKWSKPQDISDFNEADKPLSFESVDNIKVQDVTKIRCINEELEGKEHPITGVKYERKIVDDGEGNKLDGVFPQFDHVFEATLEKNELKSSDIVQFNRSNNQLKEAVKLNPELAGKFTPQQLEMIEYGRTPRGYTWHHSEEVGKLQLVKTEVHDKTRHTGGRKIWGGGTENR